MKRNKKKHDSPLPPLVIIRGRQEAAFYREQQVPEFAGNPLIEALPPLWTLDEVTKLLSYSPPYSDEQRHLPDEVRLHLLENMRELFITQTPHLEIHLSMSNMMRRGYVQRNPMLRGSAQAQQGRIARFMAAQARRSPLQSKARGLSIVGPGGMGKSTAVENYLWLYPQVIDHTKYGDEDFLLKQLVWLKLECPREGSIKSLCIHFFLTVDDILGTNYFEKYGSGRRTLDDLLAGMIRVASWHYLGLLSVDEIQNLSEAKSGGEAKMVNFFVQLENTIGVPFNLIGTPDAHRLLMGRFRQARRACEQGALYWDRMKEVMDDDEAEGEAGSDPHPAEKADPVWEEFVRILWKYQYLRTPQPLAKDLLADKRAHALYEESQGITGVAVTLYFLAQRRAIVRGDDERLTPGTIRTVVKENQHLIKPLLDSLKAGVTCGPYVVPDLVERPPQFTPPKPPDEDDTPPDVVVRESRGTQAAESAAPPQPPQTDAAQANDPKAQGRRKRAPRRKGGRAEKAPPPVYGKGDLRNVASQVAAGASVDEALNKVRGVRPEDESSGEGVAG